MQDQRLKLKNTLAKIIKNNRLKIGKSINKLANEVEMSPARLSEIENSKSDPQFSTVWRVAEALDIPLSEIVKEVEKQLKNKKLFLD